MWEMCLPALRTPMLPPVNALLNMDYLLCLAPVSCGRRGLAALPGGLSKN